MKRTIIVVASLTLLGMACKKSGSSSPAYYITANMDGTAITFNVNAKVLMIPTGFNFTMLSVSGNAAPNVGEIQINIIPSYKPIVIGTYVDTTFDFNVSSLYIPGGAPNPTSAQYEAPGPLNPPNPFTITITSLDSTTVKGTFSGDVWYTTVATPGVYGPMKKTFTNGQFYVHVPH